jgi:hypothetical protein
MRRLVLTVLLSLTSVVLCSAQSDRAAVTGTITDPAHAAIPNAHITIVYPDTGLSRGTTTTNSGAFQFSELPIGACYVEVGAGGFQTVKTATFALNIGETRELNLMLPLASAKVTVEVTDIGENLQQSNATVGDVLLPSQLNSLPVNGRDWKSLMALVPGAANGGMFFSSGGDDMNYRVDGADASGIRDQNMKVYSRLTMSQDAVDEFRVSSALFSADTGGTPGGQLEAVTKSGSNTFHGSAFEYLRNDILDARSTFDPPTIPPFRLNQFGATLGGPVLRDKTFFFLSYEGYRQSLGETLIGDVPSPALHNQVLASSPVLEPFIDAYPLPNDGLLSSDVGQWTGQGWDTEDADVGTVRLDQKFSPKLSAFFRFTRTYDRFNTPETLGEPNPELQAPTSGVLGLQSILSPRSINEFRFGVNYVPWNSLNPGNVTSTLSVPGLSAPTPYEDQVWNATSEDLVDSFTTVRGNQTLKAGVEVRRVLVDLFATPTYKIAYASIPDFVANELNTATGSDGKPARTQEKTEYFGYIQDDWKITRNFTANLGLRYDFFNEFKEAHGRTLGFSLEDCGGYCQYGLPFGNPATKDFAPRLSLAWSPERLRDRTVIRVGGGIYYGDGQLGDQQAPITNQGWSYSLSSAITPNLMYPIVVDPNNLPYTAPTDYDRHRSSEDFQEWTAQVQQLLPWGLIAQAGYLGIQAFHLSSKSYENLIDRSSGQRPLPQFGQIGTVGSWETSSFHGLLMSLDRSLRSGLFLKLNYTLSHAINDDSQGGGGPQTPQDVNCILCERASSSVDQRHSLYGSFIYALPLGNSHRWGGWSVSGVNSFYTGWPVDVTITRKASTVPGGNTTNQRPDYLTGTSLVPAGGKSIDDWINLAAFATPANGKFGNAGRNIARGPTLFQIDGALQKSTNINERLSLIIRADVFNVFNHPNFGSPNANISSPATFGRITNLENTTPIGTGGKRSIQMSLRLKF